MNQILNATKIYRVADRWNLPCLFYTFIPIEKLAFSKYRKTGGSVANSEMMKNPIGFNPVSD